MGGPIFYRPQYTIILIIGTRKGTPYLEKPGVTADLGGGRLRSPWRATPKIALDVSITVSHSLDR